MRLTYLSIFGVLGLVVTGPALCAAQVAAKTTGVSVSLHNFNNAPFSLTVQNSEVCRPCHTPHNVIANQDYLWNRAAPTASYTLYNVAHPYTVYTSNYSAGLDSASKVCLSCHDGTIAVDNYGGVTTGTHRVPTAYQVGASGNLRNDHPVGLSYPGLTGTTVASWVWAAQPGYMNPTAAVFSADGNGTAKGVQLVQLPSGQWGVGCSSCHDAHNSYPGMANLLRTSMQYSFLCLKCHDK